MRMKPHDLYARAVVLIAENDEPTWDNVALIAEQMSVVIIAATFGVSPTSVARDVVAVRQKLAARREVRHG